MDINEAALRLKKIDVIERQIAHLQFEAANGSEEYAEACNAKAQELFLTLKEF